MQYSATPFSARRASTSFSAAQACFGNLWVHETVQALSVSLHESRQHSHGMRITGCRSQGCTCCARPPLSPLSHRALCRGSGACTLTPRMLTERCCQRCGICICDCGEDDLNALYLSLPMLAYENARAQGARLHLLVSAGSRASLASVWQSLHAQHINVDESEYVEEELGITTCTIGKKAMSLQRFGRMRSRH